MKKKKKNIVNDVTQTQQPEASTTLTLLLPLLLFLFHDIAGAIVTGWKQKCFI